MLQLNLTKLNLDLSLSARRIFQSSVVKTPMLWLFHSLHEKALPCSETGIRGSDDSLLHGSKWGRRFDQIPAHVITWDWSVSMWFWDRFQLRPILTIIYVIRKMENVPKLFWQHHFLLHRSIYSNQQELVLICQCLIYKLQFLD